MPGSQSRSLQAMYSHRGDGDDRPVMVLLALFPDHGYQNRDTDAISALTKGVRWVRAIDAGIVRRWELARKNVTYEPPVYRFRVRILGGAYAPENGREIIREIEIAANQTLADLAEAIVFAYEFDLDHLWSFFLSGRIYDQTTEYTLNPEPSLFGGAKAKDAGRTPIRSVPFPGSTGKKEFVFLFDYGDDWEFGVKLLGTTPTIDPAAYPQLVKAIGESPEQYPNWDEEDDELGQMATFGPIQLGSDFPDQLSAQLGLGSAKPFDTALASPITVLRALVRDVERSLGFWVDVLGWQVLEDRVDDVAPGLTVDGIACRAVRSVTVAALEIPVGGLQLTQPIDPETPIPAREGPRAGEISVSLLTGQIDELNDRFRSAGVTISLEPRVEHLDGETVTRMQVLDPDGIRVGIFQAQG